MTTKVDITKNVIGTEALLNGPNESVDGHPAVFDGTTGKLLKDGGAFPVGFENPMTTPGDIIKGGTSGAASRLAIGSQGQILTALGSVPTYYLPPHLAADVPPVSPTAYDDEFPNTSLDSKWTTIGAAGAVHTVQDSFYNVVYTAADNEIKGIEQAISGNSWKVRTHVYWESDSVNYNGPGILIKNSSNGRYVTYNVLFHTSHGYMCPFMFNASNANTYVGEASVNSWIISNNFFLEVEYDGTNLIFRHSTTGFFYKQLMTVTTASYLGGTPTHVGVGMRQFGSATFDWFRKVA